MHDLAIASSAISIRVSLEAGVRWGLEGSAHESDAVAFEHRLE